MRMVTNEQIANLSISSARQLKWIDDCLREKNSYDLPAKISIHKQELLYNFMPAVMEKYNLAGIKIVNRYPNRKPTLNSQILLYDYANGELKAILDGNLITSMRTGAVAVHSIQLLAKKNFRVVALMGLGEMMRSAATILFDTYIDRPLTVKLLRYKNQAEQFIADYSKYDNVNFVIMDTLEELMSDSEVIVSAITYTDDIFCDEKIYCKGCLIVPIHTRGFQNCDKVFDKIYGDDYNHIVNFQYFKEFRTFNEVAEVIKNPTLGRQNDDERIIAYNIGLAIYDMYYVNQILQLLPNLDDKL